MNKLFELQKNFQDYILNQTENITHVIEETGEMSNQERLDIYREGYFVRLTEIIAEDYPALHKLMGEDAFSSMMRAYLVQHATQHFSVRHAGQHLPTFLENISDIAPIFVELARFEWALSAAMFAADAPLMTHEHFSQIPEDAWPDQRFHFHPSVSLVRLHYNTMALSEAVLNETPIPEPGELQTPETVMVWRRDLSAFYVVLSEAEASLATGIIENETFSMLCMRLAETFNESELVEWIINILSHWTEQSRLTVHPK